MSEAAQTTTHEVIRNWVESRDGWPARVRGSGDGGILRIDFDPPDDALERIGWDEFFRIFEASRLAFLHQDMTEAGGVSRFNKFVSRDSG